MKRSEMLEVVRKALDDGTRQPDERLQVAEHLVTGLGAVLRWDPEESEWPELEPLVLGYSRGSDRCVLVPPGQPDEPVRGMSAADAERIVETWNYRRPGGMMEESLLALAREAESYNDFTAGFGSRLREVLRLGVD